MPRFRIKSMLIVMTGIAALFALESIQQRDDLASGVEDFVRVVLFVSWCSIYLAPATFVLVRAYRSPGDDGSLRFSAIMVLSSFAVAVRIALIIKLENGKWDALWPTWIFCLISSSCISAMGLAAGSGLRWLRRNTRYE